VKSLRIIGEQLGHPGSLEIELSFPAGENVEDPQSLELIARLSDAISAIDGLGRVSSLLDPLRRVNQLLHDDDPAHYAIGDTRGANAELLELVSFDHPEILANLLSLDRSHVRLSAELERNVGDQRERVVNEAERLVASMVPARFGVLMSGELVLSRDWTRDLQSTQLGSFPVAFAIVFALVGLYARSVSLALAALVPTLLAILATLGAMAWLDMSLDVGRGMIAVVLLGIGVDDSVHLLAYYRGGRLRGESRQRAMREAIVHTGRALITTSLALSLGFLTLTASAWNSISSFGLLVSIAIAGALVATLLVLPALVAVVAPARDRALALALAVGARRRAPARSSADRVRSGSRAVRTGRA
jgi:predicted RND superfamily exporter protein